MDARSEKSREKPGVLIQGPENSWRQPRESSARPGNRSECSEVGQKRFGIEAVNPRTKSFAPKISGAVLESSKTRLRFSRRTRESAPRIRRKHRRTQREQASAASGSLKPTARRDYADLRGLSFEEERLERRQLRNGNGEGNAWVCCFSAFPGALQTARFFSRYEVTFWQQTGDEFAYDAPFPTERNARCPVCWVQGRPVPDLD